MDGVFWFVVAIVLLIWGYRTHASKKYMRDAIRNIPGPPAIPILGCVKEIAALKPTNILSNAQIMFKNYGPVMKLWAFNRIFIPTADVEFNEQILASITHITKIPEYGVLHQWLGVGLLMSDGKKWHSRRKIITPTFHFKILEEFLEVFDRQSSILLECLEEKADGRTAFDVYQFMCLYTLDVISESAMGTRVNAQTNKTMEYTKAVNEMTELMAWRFIRIILTNETVFSILFPFKKLRQMKLIRIMRDFTKNVIEERRALLESNLNSKSANSENTNDIGCKKRSVLIDVLLQSTVEGQPLSDEDIREEVDTFMFEGHDTTASALSFALYLLARHPRVQMKILAEIEKVYGEEQSSPKFTLMNLNEMKYLECVIKESLRMYTPVPVIGRKLKEEFKYKHSVLGDGIIPAGAEITINIWATLNNPKRFENPNQFIPERYETIEANASIGASPFSAGPRNCIGQKFAMYEMKMTLVKIIKKFELLPLGEDVRPVVNIVMRSENGVQLGMRRR